MKPQTCSDLTNLVGWLIHTGKDINLTQLDIRGGVAESLLSSARQRKLDLAIKGDYTHIAMFDDDMTFPKDTVHQLLKHEKDFVCANVCQKTPEKISGVCLDLKDGKRINSDGAYGLEEVSYGTLACTLIRLDAIRHVQKPHFEVLWSPELNNNEGGYQGEDHYFMRKIREYGVKLYCDHDLTKQVAHVGDYPYKFNS
jgi:hypothetical protein